MWPVLVSACVGAISGYLYYGRAHVQQVPLVPRTFRECKSQRGKISAILSCMYAGKTTELQRRARLAVIAKKSVVMVKYKGDTRYSENNEIFNHDKITVKIRTIACEQLSVILSELSAYEYIFIDEGQFFPDLVEISDKLANSGKKITIAALNARFDRQPFSTIAELTGRCETILKLEDAVCEDCGYTAAFSYKVTAKSSDINKDIHAQYIPVCRECYNVRLTQHSSLT